MFNVCPHCGLYTDEKAIDPDGPFAICPHCGYRHRFVRLPLFIVTGASGAGKTATCVRLAPQMAECVCLEADIFWRQEFNTPENDYRAFRNLCLRLAKNIGQSGRPVALFGSAVPAQYETCPERRYFSTTHYLAMVCDDDVLVERLRGRPAWRGTSSDEFIARTVEFNTWLRVNAERTTPPMALLDTTDLPVEESVAQVAEWIWRCLESG